MRTKTQIYKIYTIWRNELKSQNLSNRAVGKALKVCHSTVAKWTAGIEPEKPQECARLVRESDRKRRARRHAKTLTSNHNKYGYEHSFEEIAHIMGLKPNEVKVVYLNATRKIKIIMERKGIDIGLIPETREELANMI